MPLYEQSPVKTLGAESLKSAFLGRSIENRLLYFLVAGEMNTFSVPLTGG